MKTIEELKQEIIEMKQELESTDISEERRRLMKQILDMTIELANLHRSHIKLK